MRAARTTTRSTAAARRSAGAIDRWIVWFVTRDDTARRASVAGWFPATATAVLVAVLERQHSVDTEQQLVVAVAIVKW